MKKYIFLTLLSLITLKINAQVEQFVYTKDDKIIKGKDVQIVSRLFGADYFRIDDQKIKTKDVLFFQDEYGFYGKVRNNNYALREEKGNINIFSIERIDYSNNGFNNGFNNFGRPTNFGNNYTNIREEFYYNKDVFGSLKTLTYRNLKKDLKDNRLSYNELLKYRKKARYEYGMYVIGGALTALGMVKIFNNNNNSNSYTQSVDPSISGTGLGMTVSGVITVGIGALIHRSRRKHLLKAIEIYND